MMTMAKVTVVDAIIMHGFFSRNWGVLNLPGNTNLMNSKFKTVATTA